VIGRRGADRASGRGTSGRENLFVPLVQPSHLHENPVMQPDAPVAQKRGEILVFFLRRDTKCAECGKELFSGSMLTLEKERGALCLGCADLHHLEFLPSGDAAVTRRATKHSNLRAIVLQWSRTRKRYERQGILVETAAIEKAEAECLEDADRRKRQAERRALRAAELDQVFVEQFAQTIRQQFPKCPISDANRIAEHACLKHSGRVGRTAAAKQFDPNAVYLAVAATVRHEFTNYDQLLLKGIERFEARARVRDAVERKLRAWRN
jgi:hypothetical protein